MNQRATKIPVTVLTGFLGAGKTTLLNRILGAVHGKRIAVIENEYGEVGIDQALVIKADEEIFEMSNGCICCTVRGDLIRILGNLAKRRDKFDYVIVETTGLADPGPVAQTFFVDDEVRDDFVLDGIVTLVDAHHLGVQHGRNREVEEQIAFADVVLINKTDLVDAEVLAQIEAKVRGMNAMARIFRTTKAEVPVDKLLDIAAFDLSTALSQRPGFLEPEYPFEWLGIYSLESGAYQLTLEDGPDPQMSFAALPVAGSDATQIQDAAERAVRCLAAEAVPADSGAELRPETGHCRLMLGGQGSKLFRLQIAEAGLYALFTQHLPEEFDFQIRDGDGKYQTPVVTQVWAPGHEHGDDIGSIVLEATGDLDGDLFNVWLRTLLAERGVDIFRLKGFISIAGEDRRYVVQGVHMLLDYEAGEPWGQAPRTNQLVVIGRQLDRTLMMEGLLACLA